MCLGYPTHRLIRLTSPNLNYLMIIGTILMYCSGISFMISADTRSMVLALYFVSVNNAQYHSDRHCVIYDPWPHCYRFERGCLHLATRVDLGQS